MHYVGDKRIQEEDDEIKISGRLKYSLGLLPFKGKAILIVGDSYGWYAEAALKNGAKKVVSFDIAKPDKKIYILEKKYKNFSHQMSSVLNLKISNQKFDQVVFLEVIEHLPVNTEHEALRHIYNHLKPRGLLLLSTPFKSILSYFGDPAAIFGHRHYSLEKLTTILTNANFGIVKFSRGGYFYSVADLLMLYVNKWLLRRKYTSPFIEKTNFEYPHIKGTTVFLICQKY